MITTKPKRRSSDNQADIVDYWRAAIEEMEGAAFTLPIRRARAEETLRHLVEQRNVIQQFLAERAMSLCDLQEIQSAMTKQALLIKKLETNIHRESNE